MPGVTGNFSETADAYLGLATHQEIGSQLWDGETPDSNPGLKDNSLAQYHWATMLPMPGATSLYPAPAAANIGWVADGQDLLTLVV